MYKEDNIKISIIYVDAIIQEILDIINIIILNK